MALAYSDLLGRPYVKGSSDPERGLDCWGCVVVAFARLGLGVPIADPAMWTKLGDDVARARQVGDVVHTDSVKGGDSGVSILVRVHEPRFLTSLEGHGVVTLPGHRLSNVRGVYRWSGMP